MRLLSVCVLLGFGTSVPCAATEKDHVRKLHPAPEMTDSQFRRALMTIDAKTQELMDTFHVPGLSMSIVKDGKVVWLKGYGYRNVEKKLPMTPDTITQIASCSKAFTSTLAIMAVRDGKLKLDDPVKKYLPYFHLKDPEADAKITLADLMCHSSGLPRTDQGWVTSVPDQEECVRLLANCEPTFAFRENAQYSNILVNTASMVTSAAYGEPWPQLLQAKILGPLEMTSTSAAPTSAIDKGRLSIGYWYNPVSHSVEREPYIEGQNVPGAGALKSTARDLSHWLQFHLGNGSFQGCQLVNPAILAEAYREHQSYIDDMSFGLGWWTDNRWPVPVVEHGGDLPGFQSLVCLLPTKHIGFEFSDTNDAAGLRGPLMQMILETLVGGRDKIWDNQPAKEIGTFVDPAAHHLLRTYFDGSVWAILDQGKPIRLTRKGWRSYETADPRNPHIKLVLKDEPADKQHPQVELSVGSADTTYKRAVKFDAGITVADLMAKTVAAYGGAAALAKPLNVEGRYEAILRQEGMRAHGLLVRCNDDLGLMERQFIGSRYVTTTLQGVNGDSGGSTQNDFRDFPLLDAELVDSQLDAQVCQALNWKSKFKKAEIIARQDLRGEPVYVLRKTPADSPNEILDFVSVKTGIVLRREAGNPASVTEFVDLRLVNGVLLPYRLAFIDSGLHEEDITISEYIPTNRYEHWAFNPLGSAKPPVD